MNNNELRDDDTLIRYMDFAKFMDLVCHQHLFFSRADTFNDKYEGFYTKQIYHLGKRITIEYDGESSSDGLFENTKRIRESSYISCWTSSNYESMAHWETFGGKNSVAIVSTFGELKKQLVDKELHGAAIYLRKVIVPIEYIDHRSMDRNLAKQLLLCSSKTLKIKNIAFEYEKEVRIIYDHLQHNSQELKNMLGKGFVVDIARNELINKIIISPKTDDWFYDLIKHLMGTYGLKEKVKWSTLRFNPHEMATGE